MVMTWVTFTCPPERLKFDFFLYSFSYFLATAHVALMLYELIVGFTQTSTDVEEQYYFTYGTPQAIAMVKNLIYVAVVSAFSYPTKVPVNRWFF